MGSFTSHFGFQKLNQGDVASTNSWKFSDADRDLLDRLLWGMFGRTYTSLDPSVAPDLTLTTSGGSIPAGATVLYEYTLVNSIGLETAPSPIGSVSTAAAISAPGPPSISYAATGGSLLPGEYFYALSSYKDVSTSETKVFDSAHVTVQAGTTTNSISMTMPTLPSGATGFNIYRRKPGAPQFVFLASTTASSYTDDGSVPEDPNRITPASNTTAAANQVTIALPGALTLDPGMTWKIYRTYISGAWSNSLVHHVVEETTEGSGVIRRNWVDVGAPTEIAEPPPINQQVSPLGGVYEELVNTGGDQSFTTTAWADVAGTDLTIPAEAGDSIEVVLAARSGNEASQLFLDAWTVVGGVAVNQFGGVNGWTGWIGDASEFGTVSGPARRTLVSADIDGTTVTVRLRARLQAAGTKTLYADTNVPLYFRLANQPLTPSATLTAVLPHLHTSTPGQGGILSLVEADRQTSSYALVLADAGKVIEMDVASSNTVTFPANAAVAFPIGAVIEIVQYGVGNTSFLAGAGVTLKSSGARFRLTTQYSSAIARKRDTNEWIIAGDLSA